MRGLPLLLLVAGCAFFGYYLLVPPKAEKKPSRGLEAQFIGYSLFEQTTWLPNTGIRLIYEYPASEVPPRVDYVWVNVTIPDSVIEKLRSLAQKYPWFAHELKYPIVMLGSFVSSIKIALDNAQDDYNILELNKTADGYLKQFQFGFKYKGEDWKYIVLYYPLPFVEYWEDNPLRYSDGRNPYRNCIPDEMSEWSDGWKLLYTVQNVHACIERLATFNTYAKYKVLKVEKPYWERKGIILYRDIDIKVDPVKQLYFYTEGRHNGGGNCCDLYVGYILEFEKKDGGSYNLLYYAHVGDWIPSTNDFVNWLINKGVNVDCAVNIYHAPQDWAIWSIKREIKHDIVSYCKNVNYTDLTKIKRIYLVVWGESKAEITYIAITSPEITKP